MLFNGNNNYNDSQSASILTTTVTTANYSDSHFDGTTTQPLWWQQQLKYCPF
jgi:hypothetical protein